MQKRKTFSREFKLEAVRLLDRGEKAAADLVRELGVRRNQLYKWKEQFSAKGEAAFPGHGRRPQQDEEIVRFQEKCRRGTRQPGQTLGAPDGSSKALALARITSISSTIFSCRSALRRMFSRASVSSSRSRA